MPIYQRGNSFMVSVGSLDDRYRKTFKTEKEAEIAELEALARLKSTGSPQLSSETPVDKPKGKTLQEAHDLTWRLYWSQNKPEGQKTHKVFCRAVFREIPMGTPVSEVDFNMILEAVEAWEDEGNGGQTVNHKVSHLSMMLKTAMEQGWIKAMPMMIRRKPGKHRFRWMNEDEEQTVLNACAKMGLDELRDFIMVAVDTGFRRGELLGLTPQDLIHGKVHLHEGETKSDKARAVPATARVLEIIRRRSNGRKVFSFTISSLRKQWIDLKTFLGLEDDTQFLVHMLRHTCASRLVQRGVSIVVVKEWLGHSNINTTMRYAKLAPDSLLVGKEALEQVFAKPELRLVSA